MDLVLVKSNQTTQCLGGELLEQDRVGGLITKEDLGLDKSVVLGLFGAEFLDDLLLSLSECQSLGLSKEVGEEDLVVVAERVLSLDGSQKVTRDHFGSLVDELVESMLTVGSGLSPNDGTSLVVDLVTCLGHALTV